MVSIQGAALSSRVGARLLFADSQSNVLSPPLLASLIFQILHLNFLAKSCIAHSIWLPLSLFYWKFKFGFALLLSHSMAINTKNTMGGGNKINIWKECYNEGAIVCP